MPTMTVIAKDGFVDLGLVRIPVEAFTGIAVTSPNDAASPKAIKVADARVKALLPVVQHDAVCNYTIALTITREPVTEGEAVACGVKETAQKARKADADAKIVNERKAAMDLVRDAERNAARNLLDAQKSATETIVKVLADHK